MTTLYNCKHTGDQYRITKFVDGEPEGSYLVTLENCDCPAGERNTCRHRQMLPRFIDRGAVNTGWMWDHDRGGWTDMRTEDEIHDGYLIDPTFDQVQVQPVATPFEPALPQMIAQCNAQLQNERDEDWARHQAEIEPAPAPRLPWRRF